MYHLVTTSRPPPFALSFATDAHPTPAVGGYLYIPIIAGATDTFTETPAGGRALALHFLANVYILGRPRGHAAHADTLLPHRPSTVPAALQPPPLPVD